MIETYYGNEIKLKGKAIKIEINGVGAPIEEIRLSSDERITVEYEAEI